MIGERGDDFYVRKQRQTYSLEKRFREKFKKKKSYSIRISDSTCEFYILC